MFKLLIVAGWAFFAFDAVLAIVSLVSRNMGDDAAGRGLGTALGLVALVLVLTGGTGLYFSMRAHSWLGAIVSILPLGLPLIFVFGGTVESWVHNVRVAMENRNVGRYPEPAQTELAKAIEAGDFETMRKILATHPNLKGRDGIGYDLLSFAYAQTRTSRPDADNLKSVEGVRLLLEAGMNPNESEDASGSSTFISSAYSVSREGVDGNVADPAGAEVFRLFLEHGADPNAVREGQPLIFAVWRNLDSLREMLDHGADINKPDRDGDTPLLFCLRNGRWDAALLLLERGADIDVQSNYGTTPETGMAQAKEMAEKISEKPMPEGYHKVKAALERRRAAEAHPPRNRGE